MDYELNHEVPSGGRARGGGSFYHLSFRSGSRAGGSSARGACAYISRTDEYAGPDHDEAVYTESEHMPSWAEDHADQYWDAADLYERANGRLYVSADFALPRDLDPADQIALAHELAHELTEKEQLPYTLAIHAAVTRTGSNTTRTRISCSRSGRTTASNEPASTGFGEPIPRVPNEEDFLLEFEVAIHGEKGIRLAHRLSQ